MGNNFNRVNTAKKSEDGQEELKEARRDNGQGRAAVPERWHKVAVPLGRVVPPQHG